MSVYLNDMGYGVGEIWFGLGYDGQPIAICGKLVLPLLSPKTGLSVENCSTISLLAYMERKE